MPGWFLYVFIALSIGSVILELESIYEFSLIFRVFVAFWKKKISSYDTKVSSDRIISSLSSRVILFVNFLFSEKGGWMFFQKAFSYLIYQNIFCIEEATSTVYQHEINAI